MSLMIVQLQEPCIQINNMQVKTGPNHRPREKIKEMAPHQSAPNTHGQVLWHYHLPTKMSTNLLKVNYLK